MENDRKNLEKLLDELSKLFHKVDFSRTQMSSLYREFQDIKSSILKTFNYLDEFKLFKSQFYQDSASFLEDNTRKLNLLKARISPPMRSRTRPCQKIEEAYRLLGASSEASDETLKQCYREKIAKNHPDKLEGVGLDEEFSLIARERSQEINQAWDIIKKHRHLK